MQEMKQKDGDYMTAEEICRGVDRRINPQAVELAEQMLFMQKKLEELRTEMNAESVTVPYDNGGGQCGIRENPVFVAHGKLLQNYIKAITALKGMIPEKDAGAATTLDELRARFMACTDKGA